MFRSEAMERWVNRVAVVTGASSGIGEAIAADLAKAGLKVVALARRLERIAENRSKLPTSVQANYYPKKCDVTSEEDVRATFEWVEKSLGGIDILVNNAGVARPGYLVSMESNLIDDVINTNLKGLIYCTQAAFKSMVGRKFNGHIVNISSIAGHSVIPGTPEFPSWNMYPPSKFAVTAINETFRNELRDLGTKIKTTNISPGFVQTEILPAGIEGIVNDTMLNPEDISQAVLYAISTPPHVQVHEIIVKPVGELI